MNTRFLKQNTVHFPDSLPGKIVAIKPDATVRVAFQGTVWTGKTCTANLTCFSINQACSVIGREGITLLIHV